MLKFLTLVSLFLAVHPLMAQQSSPQSCHLTSLYLEQGWVIHDPSEFKSKENEIATRLKTGLENGSIIIDISGPIMTKDTIDQQEVFLAGFMFDDLNTERDIMYGDIAFVEFPEKNNERVEIRWFDGKNRHIVFNPKFLTCFTDIPPYVDNSVL